MLDATVAVSQAGFEAGRVNTGIEGGGLQSQCNAPLGVQGRSDVLEKLAHR